MTATQRRHDVIRAGHAAPAGPEHVALVRRGLADGAAAVRAAAIGAAERLGVLTNDDIAGALADSAAEVVRRGAEAAARIHRLNPSSEPDAVDVQLLQRLAGPDVVLAEVSAWSLGERCVDEGGAPDAVARALAEAVTTHADALVREAAVAALGCAAVASTLPAVLRACADKATVRRRAVLALAAFEGTEVDEALLVASTDRDWQVRQAAEDLRGGSRATNPDRSDEVGLAHRGTGPT